MSRCAGGFLSRRYRLGFCLLALLSATGSQASEPLDELLADYRALGLPAPPDDAVLALRRPSGRSSINGVETVVHYLAFVEKPTSKTERGHYWIGAERVAFGSDSETWQEAPADRQTLEKAEPVPHGDQPNGFKTIPELALAIQCQARGWDELAQALLDRSRKPWLFESDFHGRSRRPPDDRHALALLAWRHWCNQFVDIGGDRPVIVQRLDDLLDGPHRLDTKARRNIVADMKRTLAKPVDQPIAFAAAIDQLLELDFTGSS